MKRPIELLCAPFAARKAALLLFGAVLVTAIGLVAAPPAHADSCVFVTGGQMHSCNKDFTANYGQQVTAHVGQQVCLCLMVRLSNGTIVPIPEATEGPLPGPSAADRPAREVTSQPSGASFLRQPTPTSSSRSTGSTTTPART